MAEVVSAVYSDIVVATAVAGMAEEINLLRVAAVNRVTPVLECSADAQVVVMATLLLDLADEVIIATQICAESLPVIAQFLAVNVDLAVAQNDATLGAVLVIDDSSAIRVTTVTQGLAQDVDLVIIACVEGVAPGLEGMEATEVGVVMVLVLELVDEGVVTAKCCADQLPVSNFVADKAQCVVTQSQSIRFLVEVCPAVNCNAVEVTSIASMAEEVNLVSVAAVNGITPVLQNSTDAQEVVTSEVRLSLDNKVIITSQHLAEILPAICQFMTVNINLVVTQGKAVFSAIFVVDSISTTEIVTSAECITQDVNSVVVADVKGVTPCLKGMEATQI